MAMETSAGAGVARNPIEVEEEEEDDEEEDQSRGLLVSSTSVDAEERDVLRTRHSSEFYEDVSLELLPQGAESSSLPIGSKGRGGLGGKGKKYHQQHLHHQHQHHALEVELQSSAQGRRPCPAGLVIKVVAATAVILLAVALITNYNAFGKSKPKISALCGVKHIGDLVERLVPEEYDVTLRLDSPTTVSSNVSSSPSTFQGKVSFAGYLTRDLSECLVFHAAGITVESAVIENFGRKVEVAPEDVLIEDELQLLVFKAKEEPLFQKGFVAVEIAYQGRWGEKNGLYRAPLNDISTGSSESVAVTQLEAESARQVFPCIDKPSAKAEIGITLDVPANLTTLSNMPVRNETLIEGGARIVKAFEKTPPMSPYLLALAVGDFHGMEKNLRTGQTVRVWATKEKSIDTLNVALDSAVKAIEYYQSWTNFTLPLPKFDLVAVPGRGGAMENWGLLLFDEGRFLVEKDEDHYATLESMNVVCHELAHQWFGNLVTCMDWNEIAVNEGFGSFFEYKCMEAISNDNRIHLLFDVKVVPPNKEARVHFPGARQHALEFDMTNGTHPLVSDESHFDAISYSKGAAIVAMVEDYTDSVSPGAFQKGIRKCLATYAYGSMTFHHLLACAFTDPGISIDLKPWVFKSGFPLIDVNDTGSAGSVRISARNYTDMQPFLSPIPLKYKEKNQVRSLLLREELVLEKKSSGPFILHGTRGYFRARYSPDAYAEIIQTLTSQASDPGDSFQLTDVMYDGFDLVNRELLEPDIMLQAIHPLFGNIESNPNLNMLRYSVIVPSLLHLRTWHQTLVPGECKERMEHFIREVAPEPIDSSSSGLEELAESYLENIWEYDLDPILDAEHWMEVVGSKICNYLGV